MISLSPFGSHLECNRQNVYMQPNFLNKYTDWARSIYEMNWDEYHSTLTCINWIVMADFPTPPPPTTTILYVWVWLDGPDDWLYRDIFNFRSFSLWTTVFLFFYFSCLHAPNHSSRFHYLKFNENSQIPHTILIWCAIFSDTMKHTSI